MARQQKTVEQTFEQLETVLEKLNEDQISLEDSFRLYQEGMKLLKECNDSIDKVEKKLMILEEGQEL